MALNSARGGVGWILRKDFSFGFFLMQSRMCLLAHVDLLIHKHSTFFSARLFLIHSLPSPYLCLRLPKPRCRTFNLAVHMFMFMFMFMMFREAHFSSLSRSV